jgi:hypothetical protein
MSFLLDIGPGEPRLPTSFEHSSIATAGRQRKYERTQ